MKLHFKKLLCIIIVMITVLSVFMLNISLRLCLQKINEIS